MSEYARGGFVGGPPIVVRLPDDECVLDRNGQCMRTDRDRHRGGMENKSDLDPRWNYIEAPRRMSEATSTLVRGSCRHVELVPVESGGEVVAHLCLTCDSQLP